MALIDTAPLGYSGMLPLGQSYALAQAVLHDDLAPNPLDSSLPPDESILDFCDACDGATTDRSGMTADQIGSAIAQGKARADVRDLWHAYTMNGPIPTDAQNSAVKQERWGAADQIQAERFVFYYARQDDAGDARFAPGEWLKNAALYVQIQGLSASTGSWVVPRSKGVQLWRYRYNGPMGGPVRTGGNEWKAVVTMAGWMTAHAEGVKAFEIAFMATLITIASLGTAAAVTIPASIAAIGVTGAMWSAAIVALGGLASAGMKAMISGDSSGLMAALVNVGSALGQIGAAGVAHLANDPGMGPLTSEARDVAKTFEKLGQYVSAEEKAIEPWINAAAAQAKQLPGVDWTAAAKTVGAAPGSVAEYFMAQAHDAAGSAELIAIHASAPWYAKGLVQFAGSLRAIEIVQTAPDSRALSTGRLTGIYSMHYLNSREGQLAMSTHAPALTRVTTPQSHDPTLDPSLMGPSSSDAPPGSPPVPPPVPSAAPARAPRMTRQALAEVVPMFLPGPAGPLFSLWQMLRTKR